MTNSVISWFIVLFCISKLAQSQIDNCSIVNVFQNPGQFAIDQQSSIGLCKEYVIGPISSVKTLAVTIMSTNLNCAEGDNIAIYNNDKTARYFDYCYQLNNKLSLLMTADDKYVFFKLTTPTARSLNVVINYNIIDVTAFASTFPPLSTAAQTTLTTAKAATASTLFPALSTASTTTAVPSNICPSSALVLTAPTGVITSPYYPNRYPNNVNCNWVINAPTNKKILLTFEVINLPIPTSFLNSSCQSDYISLTEYVKPNDIYRLCGVRNGVQVITKSNLVLINFYSNPITETPYGFKLIYTIIDSINQTITTTTPIATTTTTTKATTTIAGATTTATKVTTTTASQPLSCGVPAIQPNDAMLRIVGGTEAVANSWPWQALITDDSFMCGASLINNQWLVTAAHCAQGVSLATFKAFLGMHNRLNREASLVIKNISAVFVYPNYVGEMNQWDNDIALLKLQTPVTFTSAISPVCLPDQGVNLAATGTTGMVTGWGNTKGTGSDIILRQTTITAQNIANCGASSNNQICAGISTPTTQGSCSGDSGGPYTMKVNGVYYLVGTVSWGQTTCQGPGVYCKVSNYVNWIKTTIASN